MRILKFGLFAACCSIALLLFSGCGEQDPIADDIAVEWELISNTVDDGQRFRSAFTLKNNGERPLGNSGWSLYFNFRHTIVGETVSENADITFINGDFYRLSPAGSFELRPGGQATIRFDGRGNLIKDDRAPAGLYFVFRDGSGNETDTTVVRDYTFRRLRTEQVAPALTSVPDAESRYLQNSTLAELSGEDLPPVLPTPREFRYSGGTVTLNGNFRIHYQEGLEFEAGYLADALAERTGAEFDVAENGEEGAEIITLKRDPELVDAPSAETYRLDVSNENGIRIRGKGTAAVFYGIQSLLGLFPPETLREPGASVSLKALSLADGPRFSYRGMHLDVSRNFNGKEAVFKLLDIMAFYKLNKFHFHLTDDEGWRLQIEELPELTEVGGFRGHTLDDATHLQPAYGSGPYPDPETSYGSGYYSREEYKEIIRYARNRHIEVIPEFDVPGHARAAIKAMEARYTRLMEEGREAEANEYLLTDRNDESVYLSAQEFNDNVISVCRESTYRFFETVVDDVLEMHREAGVPLQTIHMGGDEVPRGSWERSPECARFIEQSSAVDDYGDLPGYFVGRLTRMLAKHDLTLAAWQEIALAEGGHGEAEINPPSPEQVTIYSWDNFTGGNRDLGYRVANAGYPVVLCNATNLYFELAYSRDPAEPGDYFGGFVDTRKAFEFMPLHFTDPMHEDALGPSEASMAQLRPDARQNIMGIQAHLWSEPIKGPDSLEYFYAPKILGLAERAWAPQPEWATLDERSRREEAYGDAWNLFANTLGLRELPRLDYLFGGYNYRLPLPGATVDDGMLHANTGYPGLTVRYTTDGSIPTRQSEPYREPVAVEGEVKLRTFDSRGRESRVVTVGGG